MSIVFFLLCNFEMLDQVGTCKNINKMRRNVSLLLFRKWILGTWNIQDALIKELTVLIPFFWLVGVYWTHWGDNIKRKIFVTLNLGIVWSGLV